MRCRLGIHAYDSERCSAACTRCGKERGHAHLTTVTSTKEAYDALGHLLRTSLRQWKECRACGWRSEPTIEWERDERGIDD